MKTENFTAHPNLFLFLAGAAATLSLPPINFLPLVFLSLAFFVHEVSKAQNAKQAFARGWWWGAGFFIPGLYWISYSLSVDWSRFWFYLPLSALALPCMMAIYTGLASLLTHLCANRVSRIFKTLSTRLTAMLAFPFFWSGFEIIRGHLFTGFPWNLIGGALTEYPALFQSASVIGIYGLGFMIACIAALLVAAVTHARIRKICLWAVGVIFATSLSYGYAYLQPTAGESKPFRVSVVQPNVPQSEKWQADLRRETFGRLLQYTAQTAPFAPDLILWPEAAMPYILADNPGALPVIMRYLPPSATLAAGTLRHDLANDTYYNSIEMVNSRGEITAHYDKHHLVPFGEYVPFAKYIPIPAVANMFGNMGRGAGPETLSIASARISPLICYESIFPGQVADGANAPEVIINVTDDSWFGDTWGPHQHLAQSRARAVEEGVPLIRAANTGISAVVDRHGAILSALPYGMTGALNATLTIPTTTNPPPAAHGGFWKFLFGLMGMYLVFVIWLAQRDKFASP